MPLGPPAAQILGQVFQTTGSLTTFAPYVAWTGAAGTAAALGTAAVAGSAMASTTGGLVAVQPVSGASAAAATVLLRSYEQLLPAAQAQYGNLAGKIQNHHIFPKYLGGLLNGPLVAIDAAYHQWITNAFRAAWPYGQVAPDPATAQQIMNSVYNQFPLP